MKKTWLTSALLAGTVLASALDYTRTEEAQQFRPGDRKRQAQEAIFFPEFQFMYGTFQNYLHKWIDRPLFLDRATRYPTGTFSYVTESSFRKEAELVRSYGFNGLGSLANTAGGSLYRDTDRHARNMKNFGLYEVPQYGFSDNNYQSLKTVLEIATASPHTARLNGKILMPSYNLFLSNTSQMRPLLEQARKEFKETFQLTAQLDVTPSDAQNYLKTGTVPDDIKEKYRREIAGLLRIYDGIQINPAVNITDLDGDYMCGYDTTFYTNIMLPLIRQELRRPEFSGKLLGNTVLHGYVNHLSGVNHGEFGTGRIRAALEAAMKGNPDYVLFFEWNEVNENTCFQPTLYNSFALQRLIRYVIGQARGEQPAPKSGDDTALPDLVFSCRETLKAGEPLQIELLNIPDSLKPETYTATVSLHDAAGKNIYTFPAEKFARNDFRAVTVTIPSEQLSSHQLLRPVLTVTGADGKARQIDNLHYIHLRPTVCTVYKSVRQPLRDLLTPEKAELTVKPLPDGRYEIAAALESPEELASLEVLDNEREIAATDRANEFDAEKNRIFVGSFSMQRGKLLPVSIRVEGSRKWAFHPWHAPNVNFAYDLTRKGDEAAGNALIWAQPCNFTLTVPRDEVEQSTLSVTVNGKSQQFKLAELDRLGKMAAMIVPEQAIRLDLEVFEKLPDHPVAVNSKLAAIHTVLKSDFRYPVYQLRAVTKSGKIYRSAPVRPLEPSPRTVLVNLFSETAKKLVTAPLLSDLLPDLSYDFVPERGAMLRGNGDARFDGQLGGGFVYCEPFSADMQLPDGKNPAPEWHRENGEAFLRFNGDHQYVNFPAETFPRGSFSLDLKLRPAKTNRPMVLFRHYDPWLGSVSAYLKYDRLYFAFGDRSLKTHKFATNLTVTPGEWNQVSIACDCKTLRFDVNGKQRSFPLTARALYFKPFVIGGHDKIEFGIDEPMSYYHGDLKKFNIRHFVTEKGN